MQRPEAMRKLRVLVASVVYQIEEYLRHGFTVVGVVGINRSPSCGVDTTSGGNEETLGRGVFMQELRNEFDARGIGVDWIGIKAHEVEKAGISLHRLLV